MSEYSVKKFKPCITVKKTFEPVVVIGVIAMLVKEFLNVDEQTAGAAGLLVYGFVRGIRNWIKNHNW